MLYKNSQNFKNGDKWLLTDVIFELFKKSHSGHTGHFEGAQNPCWQLEGKLRRVRNTFSEAQKSVKSKSNPQFMAMNWKIDIPCKF